MDQRLPVKWGRWFTFSTDKKTLYGALSEREGYLDKTISPLILLTTPRPPTLAAIPNIRAAIGHFSTNGGRQTATGYIQQESHLSSFYFGFS